MASSFICRSTGQVVGKAEGQIGMSSTLAPSPPSPLCTPPRSLASCASPIPPFPNPLCCMSPLSSPPQPRPSPQLPAWHPRPLPQRQPRAPAGRETREVQRNLVGCCAGCVASTATRGLLRTLLHPVGIDLPSSPQQTRPHLPQPYPRTNPPPSHPTYLQPSHTAALPPSPQPEIQPHSSTPHLCRVQLSVQRCQLGRLLHLCHSRALRHLTPHSRNLILRRCQLRSRSRQLSLRLLRAARGGGCRSLHLCQPGIPVSDGGHQLTTPGLQGDDGAVQPLSDLQNGCTGERVGGQQLSAGRPDLGAGGGGSAKAEAGSRVKQGGPQ